MLNGFIVKKGEMSGHFTPEGKRIPLTVLHAQPLIVTQIKKVDSKDGYSAIQLAYGQAKHLNPSSTAKLKKLKLEKLKPYGYAEFKPESEEIVVGQEIKMDQVFKEGDSLMVTGLSKGHGFQGVVKRHGFHRQGVTGGQSDRTRAPGSIGAQTPGKVVKGKRMPGHMGHKIATLLNLKIVKLDPEKNLIYVKGSLPGHKNAWLTLTKTKLWIKH